MDVTAQTMTLTDAERFDVIIGTNVFVYYAGMRSVGYSKILYSNREEDGDLIIWYQKGPK